MPRICLCRCALHSSRESILSLQCHCKMVNAWSGKAATNAQHTSLAAVHRATIGTAADDSRADCCREWSGSTACQYFSSSHTSTLKAENLLATQTEDRDASLPEVYTLPPFADELNEELPPLPPLLKEVAEACPLPLVLAEAPLPPARRKKKQKTEVGRLQPMLLLVQKVLTDHCPKLAQATGDKHKCRLHVQKCMCRKCMCSISGALPGKHIRVCS